MGQVRTPGATAAISLAESCALERVRVAMMRQAGLCFAIAATCGILKSIYLLEDRWSYDSSTNEFHSE